MNRRNFPLFKPQPAPRLVRLGTRLLAINTGAALLLATTFWLVGVRPNPVTAVGPRYVAPSGSDAGNTCLDWDAPCRTIQHAVDQAASGEEIRVAAGTYAGVTGNSVLTQSVYINAAITLRGGFTTTNWTDFDPAANVTVIDAQNGGRVMYIDGSIAPTIEGFTLQNGTAPTNDDGGGVYVQSGSPTLRYNTIISNTASRNGGGIFDGGSATVHFNTIRGNTSGGFGGGIELAGGGSLVEYNTIFSNTGTALAGVGGGINNSAGSNTIQGNIIYGNQLTGNSSFGGGIGIIAGTVAIQSNILYANQSNSGGGVANGGGSISLWNNTVVSNTAVVSAGGIYNETGSATITNTIIAGNSASDGGGLYVKNGSVTQNNNHYYQNSAPTNPQSNVGTGGSPLLTDPKFANAAANNFHLTAASPDRNAGDGTAGVPFDVDGQVRPFDTAIDVGADEYYGTGTCFARLNDATIYTNLQTAVDAAAGGDTVKVAGYCAGSNPVLSLSKAITLTGGYSTTNWTARTFGPTVLDGGGVNQAVSISGAGITPTLDGFHITGSSGAGVSIAGSAQPVLQNNVIYSNAGHGVSNANGATVVRHNTIYSNTGDGIANTGGTMIIANTLVITNGGTGISSGGGSPVLRANDVFGNSGGSYSGVSAGPGSLSVNPRLQDAAGGDFHLTRTSPALGQANPAYTPAADFEGDARPQGQQSDMGADEATVFPDVILSPNYQQTTEDGVVKTYNHTLTNNGAVQDTFFITYTHSATWNVQIQPQGLITLPIGGQTTIAVSLTIPAGASPGSNDVMVISATSQLNPAVVGTAVNTTSVRITPNGIFTPAFNLNLDPGDVVTVTHIFTNTGNYTDTYVFTLSPSPSNQPADTSWGTLLPTLPYTQTAARGPYTYTLAQNESIFIKVRVKVPPTAEASLQNIYSLIATSQEDLSPDPNFSVSVDDTIIANAISGDRYVSPAGDDTINNCTVSDQPCATIKRGVNTVSVGNTVYVAQGTYSENNIQVNGSITLQGGWATDFSERDSDPALTIIDAQNSDRALWILNGSPTVQGFTVQNGNISARGGGLYIDGNASPTIHGNIFYNNTAATDGGGVAVKNGSPVIKNNVFYSNSAANGGGIYVATGDATLVNNTVIGNQASTSGGGIYNGSGTTIISNTIVASNTAAVKGGGVYNSTGSAPMDYNNFYNNTAPASPQSNVAVGSNSLSALPGLVNIAGLDFHVTTTSAMVDVADPRTTNLLDFEDDARPVDQGFDIGADELAGCLARVNSTGQTFGNVQQAVNVAPEGDIILISGYCRGVQPATVAGSVISQTVILTKNLTLSGGWRGDFSKQDQLDTTLDAEAMGRTLVISGSISATIESLNLINGSAAGFGGGPAGEDAGGAVYIFDGSPTFNWNTYQYGQAELGGGIYNHAGSPIFSGDLNAGRFTRIISNTASARGGGFYNYAGAPAFDNTYIMSNTAQYGGGFYNRSGQPNFDNDNNHILNNQAAVNGGGFYNYAGAPRFNADAIYRNSALNGGGFYNAASTPFTITNMLIFSNTATGNGAGFYNQLGNPTLWNVTVAHNTAAGNGGGFYNLVGSPLMVNTILFENGAAQGGGIFVNAGSPALRYNDAYNNSGGDYSGVAAGSNSISADPLFTDPAHGDFHLLEGSPAIDAGDPDTFVTSDIDAEIRPSNQGYDIGADELGGCFAQLNDGPDIYGSVQQAVRRSASITDVVKVAGHCRGVQPFDAGGGQTISATVFLSKTLTLQGGWNEDFSAQNVTTTLNAGSRGHVIYIAGGAQPAIELFDIIYGLDGAVYNTSAVSPTLKNTHIYSNTATNGAGIYNDGGNIIVERGNKIYNNTATGNGAAFYTNGGAPALQNNFIYDNSALAGGGVYIAGGTARVWHNTLVGNTATGGSGAGVYRAGGTPDIRGNIVAEGTGSGMHDGGGSGAADYNNVVNNSGGKGTLSGVNDLHAASTFTDLAGRDLTLTQDSPDINAGDRALFGLLTEDYEGNLRPSHQTMDIGADEVPQYEITSQPNYGVFPGCFARIVGSPTIYGSAQYALELAQDGDTVDVAGLCRGVNTLGGTTQNLYLTKTVTVRGGWQPDFSARDTFTILYPEGLGRGVYLTGGASVTQTVDRFRIATAVGGAVYNNNTDATVKNNALYNNTATGNGAAIYNQSGNPAIWHNTVISNTATGNGGGVYVQAGSPTIRNNIFAGNTAAAGSAIYVNGGAPDIDYNNTWNNTGGNYGGTISTGGSNAVDDTDPFFISQAEADEDFVKLSSLSPLINIADPNSPVSDDFENQPRPSDVGFDIGADEYAICLAQIQETGVVYGTVQEAVDNFDGAQHSTINVHGYCNLLAGQSQIVTVDDDIAFEGGWDEDFAGLEVDPSTLDGQITGTIAIIMPGVTASFSNFIMTNGRSNTPDGNGGAVYNLGTLNLINPLYVISNTAVNHGGGIYNEGILSLDTSLETLGVISNTAGLDGGGVYNAAGAELTLNGGGLLEVNANTAGRRGGGVYNSGDMYATGVEGISFNQTLGGDGGGIYNNGLLDIVNALIEQNSATGNGGGLYSAAPITTSITQMDLVNVMFYRNSATGNGGGIYGNNSIPHFIHNTINENQSGGQGGGIYNTGGAMVISNSIVFSNTAGGNGGGIRTTGGASIAYTDFFSNTTPEISGGSCATCYAVDPLLNDGGPVVLPPPMLPFSFVWVLNKQSPAIDAGDPHTDLTFDCCGNGRPYNAGYDLGIYERELVRGVDLKHTAGGDVDGVHTQYTDPLTSVVFTHTLKNTGELTDTFDVSISSSTTNWAKAITPTQVTLGVGATTNVIVTVTVPFTWGGATDDTVITATSLNSRNDVLFTPTLSALQEDSLTDRTIVNEVVKFAISNNEGYGAPNQTLTYTHFITNQSNISGTVNVVIFLDPQYGEMTLLSSGSFSMAYLDTVPVDVSLTLPGWIAGGIDDESYVIVKAPDYPLADFPDAETAGLNTTHISYTVGTRYVSLTGNDGDNSPDETVKWNNCTDPLAPACRTFAHALEQAAPGDLIKVAAGDYTTVMTGPVAGATTNPVLYLDKSIAIKGGYTTADWDTSLPLTNTTILNAGSGDRAVVVSGSITVTLDSLELTGGNASNGAGVLNNGANLTMLATIVHDNIAATGGGISSTGVITLRNNVLYSNSNSGLHVGGGQAVVEYNTLYGNTSLGESGGADGGGIYLGRGVLTASNNIFHSNAADSLFGNGGAIFVSVGATATITNNLYFNNTAFAGPNVSGALSGTAYLADPLLVNPAGGNFHLTKGSPAEEKGVTLAGLTDDYEHEFRPQGQNYDLGADERLHLPGVAVGPDYTTNATAFGQLVTYVHTITNTGEDPDVFTLTHASSQNWANFTQVPLTVSLGISPTDKTALFTVTVTTGPPGSGGVSDVSVITATSRLGIQKLNRQIIDTAVDTTTIVQTFDMAFAGNNRRSTTENTVVSYSHVITNLGNGTDRFAFSALSSRGWTVNAPGPVTLDSVLTGSNYTRTVVVQITVPAGAGGQTDVTVITATSQISPALRATVVNTTSVPLVRGLVFAPNRSQSGNPNATVTYLHTVTNTGNASDTVQFSGVSSRNWSVTIVPTRATLLAGESAPVSVLVDIPPGTPGGTIDYTTITATSIFSPATVRDTVVNTTSVAVAPGVLLGPDYSRIVDPGATITYTHILTNVGNLTDTYTLSHSSSRGWLNSRTAGPITLSPNQTATVTASVTVPPGGLGQVDVTVITATSTYNSAVTDSATDSTRGSQSHGLSFFPNRNQTAASGQTITYTHTLSNTGNGQDTFSLTAASSNGWVTAVKSPLTLNAQTSASVVVSLTIPLGTNGMVDTMRVTAASTISPAFSAAVTDTTTVSGTTSITAGVSLLPPANSRTVLAGNTVYYTHTLTNLGNALDSFSLAASSGQGWAVSIPAGRPVSLGAGTSAEVIVAVTVPGGAAVNTVDATVVTATSALDPGVTAVATETTTVTTTRIVGVRIAPDRTGTGQPGDTVIYFHTLTNLGNAADSFTLTVNSSQNWAVVLTPTAAALNVNQTAPVTVSATIPLTGTGSTVMSGTFDVTTIRATSAFNPAVFDTAADTTTIVIPPQPGPSIIYLPIILKAWAPPPTPTPTSPPPTNTPVTPPATNTPIPGVDLIVTGISYNAAANSATITVKNQGSKPAGIWFFVDLYVDRDPVNRSDLGDYFGTVGSLGAGATTNVTLQNVTLSAGSHQLYAQADTYDGQNGTPANGRIVESNETNNEFGPVTVTAKIFDVEPTPEPIIIPPRGTAEPPPAQ